MLVVGWWLDMWWVGGGWTCCWVDKRVGGQVGWWVGRCVGGQVNGWVDLLMNGWVDLLMNGYMCQSVGK